MLLGIKSRRFNPEEASVSLIPTAAGLYFHSLATMSDKWVSGVKRGCCPRSVFACMARMASAQWGRPRSRQVLLPRIKDSWTHEHLQMMDDAYVYGTCIHLHIPAYTYVYLPMYTRSVREHRLLDD